jgi:molybdopterin-biosynthesis enzyme MoeA-like protein
MNFYALIIGTEILNARREDKHFVFLRDELKKYGYELFASFIIKDDEKLIEDMFEFIKKDKNAILFSFGGIGSTPDDLTRAISAKVFTNEKLVRHKQFEKDILDRFEKNAYPHRIHMSDLPKESQLLKNPINNMSGYSLFNKFFFVPGFPQMAHPMIKEVLKTKFNNAQKKYRLTLLAQTSENTLIDIMNNIPKNMDLSSLPIIKDKNISVEISLSNTDNKKVEKYFLLFTNFLKDKKIPYKLIL